MSIETVNCYSSRGGVEIWFTRAQQTALQRAGQWSPLCYTFRETTRGRPTHTDAEIAQMIRNYKKLTHVGVLHPDYRSPDRLFFIRNPKRYAPDATTQTFGTAMECASQEFGCDVVTISEHDCTHGFHEFAADWRVILLVCAVEE